KGKEGKRKGKGNQKRESYTEPRTSTPELRQTTLSVTPKQEQNVLLEEIRKLRLEQREMKSELKRDMQDLHAEMRADYKKEMKDLKDSIKTLQEEARSAITKVGQLETDFVELQGNLHWEREKEMDERALLEMKMRENSLKIRGLREEREEKLRQTFIPIFAKILNIEEQKMDWEIDKISRVGSIKNRKSTLPRDIVITCVKKSTKEAILHYSARNEITINGQRVTIYRDIPIRILQKRREYNFLTSFLREQAIQYRWARLQGLSFRYQTKWFVINSVDEAKEFMRKLGKEDTQKGDPPPEGEIPEDLEGERELHK
uniref:L1 transposable element RRM domain-containing protein n=1 Tax=Anolis carolinensis TaxID=28377 RepID=A0A803T4L6_ANOCA